MFLISSTALSESFAFASCGMEGSCHKAMSCSVSGYQLGALFTCIVINCRSRKALSTFLNCIPRFLQYSFDGN